MDQHNKSLPSVIGTRHCHTPSEAALPIRIRCWGQLPLISSHGVAQLEAGIPGARPLSCCNEGTET